MIARRRSIDIVFASDKKWLIEHGIIPAISAISPRQGGAKPQVRIVSRKHLRVTWSSTSTAEPIESIQLDKRWSFVVRLVTQNGGAMS